MTRQKDEAKDELAMLVQRLFKAKVSNQLKEVESIINPPKEEPKETEDIEGDIEDKDELDLDRPVDVRAFEQSKVMKNKYFEKCEVEIKKLQKMLKRDPTT